MTIELTYDQKQELERKKEVELLKSIFAVRPKWKVIDHSRVEIENGLQFLLYSPWNDKTKWNISGSYPRTKDNDYFRTYRNEEQAPSIGVSKNKSPEKICRDIEKRFIPEFVAFYETALAWCNSQDSYHDAQKANVEIIAKVLNTEPYDTTKVRSSDYGVNLAYVSREHVKLEFDDLTPSEGVELIEFRKIQLTKRKV